MDAKFLKGVTPAELRHIQRETMKTAIRNPEDSLIFSSQESILKTYAELIETLRNRINVKRLRPQKGYSIKLAYIRAYIQALLSQNIILKDAELDNLEKEIEELKQLMKCKSYNLKGDLAGILNIISFL